MKLISDFQVTCILNCLRRFWILLRLPYIWLISMWSCQKQIHLPLRLGVCAQMKAVHLKQVPLKIVYIGSPYYITVFNLNTSFFLPDSVGLCITFWKSRTWFASWTRFHLHFMEENVLANTAPYWLKKNLHKYINKVFSASCEFLTSDIFHINVDSTAISAEIALSATGETWKMQINSETAHHDLLVAFFKPIWRLYSV